MKNQAFLIIFLSFILSGCSHKVVKVVHTGNANGSYDSEFPYNDASKELESITHSVCKIYSVVSYKTYYFKLGVSATKDDLSSGNYVYKSFGATITNETTSGTATVIYHAFGKFALMSCAHVVVSPDTLVTYFRPLKDEPEQFISSISVKNKQEIFIKELGTCGKVDVLAIDRESDVIIVGRSCEIVGDQVTTFNYTVGNAKDLKWGSFVYVIGYPLGNLMVTKGIVSIPKNDESGTFLVDAMFNRGFSGGIVLALRDGAPNFELVGVIRSVPSQKEYFIKPEKEPYEMVYDENVAYKGDFYVGTHDAVSYGVTAVIPVEKIRELYQKNRSQMQSLGYDLDGFFRQTEKK